jgi:hypothetical protein
MREVGPEAQRDDVIDRRSQALALRAAHLAAVAVPLEDLQP